MGKLERKLNLDLISRLKAGVKHKPAPLRTAKPPRARGTYRGARRNLLKTQGEEKRKPRLKWVNIDARPAPIVARGKTWEPNGNRECVRRVKQSGKQNWKRVQKLYKRNTKRKTNTITRETGPRAEGQT